MAKKKVTMSQAIRNYFTENPKAKAREVVAGLGEKGIKVKEGLVYAVKGGMKEKKRRKKAVAKAALAATGGATVSNGVSAKTDAIMIREVKALAGKVGGYAKLKELVD